MYHLIKLIREEYERIIFEEIKKRSNHEKFGLNMMQERDEAFREVEKLKT
jgi:hypothetical protein